MTVWLALKGDFDSSTAVTFLVMRGCACRWTGGFLSRHSWQHNFSFAATTTSKMNSSRFENNNNEKTIIGVRPSLDPSIVETVDITATITDPVPQVVVTTTKKRRFRLLKRTKSTTSSKEDGIGSHFGKRAVREAMPQLVETTEKSTAVLAEAIKFTATKGENASVNIAKAHKESLIEVMDWVGLFVALYMSHVLRGHICKDWPVLDYFAMLIVLSIVQVFFKKVWFPLVLK